MIHLHPNITSNAGGGRRVLGALTAFVFIFGTACRLPDANTAMGRQQSPEPSRATEGTISSPAPGVPQDAQRAVVAKHVDGDTIWVEIKEPGGPLAAGAAHKIRMLMIDTPESTNRTDCFGLEASEFAKSELPLGSTVYLLGDREDKDRFGRFLRYVWDHEGEFYNEKAVRMGYAKAVLYMPNDRYISRVRQAEADARPANRGLWRACANARKVQED